MAIMRIKMRIIVVGELRFGVTHLAIAVRVAHFWLRVDNVVS